MERKLQEQEGSLGAMAASPTTLRSLLHRIAQGCAGYLGLGLGFGVRGGHPKPAAEDAIVEVQQQQAAGQQQEEEFTVVEVKPRSMAFQQNRNFEQGTGGRGGIKY